MNIIASDTAAHRRASQPYARFLTVGSNADLPKTVRLPIGVGVDGCTITVPYTIKGDEMLCPSCGGLGENEYDETCERCSGEGIVKIEQETVAVSRCLPAAAVGRPVFQTVAGRPPHSGMTPDSRATGGLSLHNAERGTQSVLRSVPCSSASDSPAANMPPIALQGTLERVLDAITVISGMAVFSAIAWFFLVLA